MEKETNLSNADNPELELGSELGKKDVSKAEDLETEATPETVSGEEYFQKITGRDDIKSKADFEKHYEGLKSLVGDQKVAEMREKAEKYDALQKEIGEKADEFLGTEEGKKLTKDIAREAIEERVDKLEGEIKVERFLKTHPEAEPILDLVQAKADRDKISFEDSYTKVSSGEKFSLQELLSTKLEAEKAKEEEKSIGVESKARIGSTSSQEVAQLAKEVEETGNLTAKEKLVEKTLGLSE